MIRHIVLFKLREFSSEEERNQALEDVLLNFRSLKGEIPQIREYQVQANIVEGIASCDVIINSCFDSLADLKAYQTHPAHQYAVEQNKQWSESKVVADYYETTDY
ncbi:MAG: Dabb family protein [Bacteroidetes bacterium]|jgi:hypothetical protein|nr:Dabb family protein [Bacteroidota bacterium]MBT3750007.1 Dabb family protein [Bacteroidota bacterium]MBT4399455.1 Dabb family protein [Bacteroidota bacterium]MBT4410005.1 Dabb family protein [Bacteroidota bacterium]MBT5425934.1 Dabb family protein [Bacteroidota bacterium]